MIKKLNIGTCSWKYDSWKGLIYPEQKFFNYLEEYSKHYNCVEVDQWFWSLFGDNVKLPQSEVVKQYAESVPDDFRFGIKVPNSITLTHHIRKRKLILLYQTSISFPLSSCCDSWKLLSKWLKRLARSCSSLSI